MVIKNGRNVYVDFFRGLALWWIFVDHTPEDRLSQATFQRISVCDAFELFVLLAGFSVSYAYGAALFRQGAKAAAEKVLRRAGKIYVANYLFCVLRGEAAWLQGSGTGRSVLDVLHLNELMNFSMENVGALLTFNYPVSFLNILPLYFELLLGFAIVLPLLRFPRVLLSLSVTLYAATYLLNLHIPGMPVGGEIAPSYPYYNPLAWQVLLVIGSVLVLEPSALPLPHPAWDVSAVAVVLAAFGVQLLVRLTQHGYDVGTTSPWKPIITWIKNSTTDSGKIILHPLRLASILAWAWIAYRLAPFYGGWLHHLWARPFILCGRHSLPVFCFGIFLAPLGGVWLATWSVGSQAR